MATETVVATGNGQLQQVVLDGITLWQLKTPTGLSSEVATHSWNVPIEDVCFTVYDIDGPERLNIAPSLGGVPLTWDPAWVLRVGSDVTDLGGGDFKGNSGSAAPTTNPTKSFDICIPGPIDQVVMTGTDTVSNSGRNIHYAFPTWDDPATTQVAPPLIQPQAGGTATTDPIATGATGPNIVLIDPTTGERTTSYTDADGNTWTVNPDSTITFVDGGVPETTSISIEYESTDGTYLSGGDSARSTYTVTIPYQPPNAQECSDCFEQLFGCPFPEVTQLSAATTMPVADNESDADIRTGDIGTSTQYALADHNHPITRQTPPDPPALVPWGGIVPTIAQATMHVWTDEESVEYLLRVEGDLPAGSYQAGWDVPNLAGFQSAIVTPVGDYRGSAGFQNDDGTGGATTGERAYEPIAAVQGNGSRIVIGPYKKDNATTVRSWIRVKYIRS